MVAELFVVGGSEEEQLHTALFRFLELRGRAYDASELQILSDGPPGRRRKRVALWSDEATAEFEAYWLDYRRRINGRHPLFLGSEHRSELGGVAGP